ncbi:hypothetical protein GF362_02060 [Candidatus Dojkabacteria bacterium]|nr:hypothetical protein [Candidatus Dojkabacteria bacterium]
MSQLTQDQNSAIPQDASALREKVQQDIVNIITKKLEAGEMTEERAKAIAKLTLEKLPEGLTYEQLMKIIPTLDDEFEELRVAVYPIIQEYQQKISKKVESTISDLMQQKKYEDALNLVKKAINFEKKLG